MGDKVDGWWVIFGSLLFILGVGAGLFISPINSEVSDSPWPNIDPCPNQGIVEARLLECSIPNRNVKLKVSCESEDYIVKVEHIPVTISGFSEDMRVRCAAGCNEVPRITTVTHPLIRFDVDEWDIHNVVDIMGRLADESGGVECTISFNKGIKVRIQEYLAYNLSDGNCSSGWKLIRNTSSIENTYAKQGYMWYNVPQLGDNIKSYLTTEELKYNLWSLKSNAWGKIYSGRE